MALSGIQIYKLLPQTNCKECGFPTCLAFAMKLAAKQVELAGCPYVSPEAKTQLAESSAPPVRLITLKGPASEIKVGNEVCLYRHEKTFYNKCGIFIKIRASQADISEVVKKADAYKVTYVGMEFVVDGFAIEADNGSNFEAAIKTVRSISGKPLILISEDQALLSKGLSLLNGETPMIAGANSNNWESLAELAKNSKAVLGVKADTLDELAALTESIKNKGFEDIVLIPVGKNMASSLANATQIRKLALKNFRPFGFPILTLPRESGSTENETIVAAQAVIKYSGFVILNDFKPEQMYALLVLRENIYTDPQKPIQVTPGLYEINNPNADSPVLVTTNFSITYFSVANEVESSGLPARLLVVDADGMSVLTAWAAGKFDAERIGKAVKSLGIADIINKKQIVIPGHVAVLSGELEEELPGWDIRVGPREAVDLPGFMKNVL